MISPRPLVSIVGPTATGKSALALSLAELILSTAPIDGVVILTADSRQVYRELSIISGADLPAAAVAQQPGEWPLPYWQQEKIAWHGTAMLDADQEWSVAHFRQFGRQVLELAWQKNLLPIVVGGSGLYHRYLLSDDPQLDIPPDLELRQKAEVEHWGVAEWQQRLQELAPTKLASMTQADQKNPRRLVRAIEIAQANTLSPVLEKLVPFTATSLKLGLNADREWLAAQIKQRVHERWRAGAAAEAEEFIKKYGLEVPAAAATGVPELAEFLAGKTDQPSTEALWALHELQYAKRQQVWWQRDQDVQWWYVDQGDTPQVVAEVVEPWIKLVYSHS